MANTMRWRYGDTNPVVLPVSSPNEVEIGDLVYLDTNTGAAIPAGSQPDEGSSVLNQTTFQDNFVGVAMQASPAGQEGSIRIATTGVFELTCDADTWELGDLVACAVNGPGTALFDQKVASAAAVAASIGRCAKQASIATTRVLVDVVSTVMRGGPQAAA